MDTHIATPNAEADPATAASIATSFVEALSARDFPTLERLFDANVRFRALVPRGLREAASAQDAAAWLHTWFGDADSFELLGSDVDTVADRTHMRYRFRVHEAGETTLVEQHAFANVADGRIADLSLVCSGFRPVADLPGSVHDSDAGGATEATG